MSLLAPFAQDDGGGDQRTIRFAGRARDDNNFSIDGVDAGGIQEQAQKSTTRLQISEDAVEEYRVSSALYDVEYGTQAGGQMNTETKSGTNNLHGTVFGYLRNSYFDARSFLDFDVNGNAAIAPFRMGQYGMSLGGPIVKDKTFFFINYEGIRQLQFNGQRMTVPAGIYYANFPTGEPQGITEPYQQYVWIRRRALASGQRCARSCRRSLGAPRLGRSMVARRTSLFPMELSSGKALPPQIRIPTWTFSRSAGKRSSTKIPGWYGLTTRSARTPSFMVAHSATSAFGTLRLTGRPFPATTRQPSIILQITCWRCTTPSVPPY